MAIEVKKISLWDTLRLQLFVSIPAFFLGLVAANRWVLAYVARHGAGRATMHFFRDLRDKYGCDHLWAWFPGWFPVRRTLLVLAPETIEAVLLSDANAADPFLKKRALSRFIPDALVISSGDEWRDRRNFNEKALYTGTLHPHHDAFKRIAFREAEQLRGERPDELRWVDFQSLGERISHQVILGSGEIKPELTAQLARMVRWSNVLLRHGPSFSAFYQQIERYLTRKEPAASTACLMHDSSALLENGSARETTRVPTQIGFWFFVLKDALELHVARTLALIASHPEVQTKARQEVRAAGTLTVEAIEGLHYLEACLREQLRLWTPVPMLLRRATKAFSLRDEIPIEAEQQILIHAGFYHRDARYFGAYADTFLPDATAYEFPTVYFFSAHRQSCAGRSLVTFLLKATLASLLGRFRFELLGPTIEPGRIPYLYDHFSVRFRAVAEA
jgi:cytochrome P450